MTQPAPTPAPTDPTPPPPAPDNFSASPAGKAIEKVGAEIAEFRRQSEKAAERSAAETAALQEKFTAEITTLHSAVEKQEKEIRNLSAAKAAAAENADASFLYARFCARMGFSTNPRNPNHLTREEYNAYRAGLKEVARASISHPSARHGEGMAGVQETLGADIWTAFTTVHNRVNQFYKFAFNEGADADGGYILPEPQANTLNKQLRENCVMMREARVIDSNKQAEEIAYAGDNGTMTAWYAEGVAPTLNDTPQMTTLTIKNHKVGALWSATEEFLEDSIIAATPWANQYYMEVLAETIEDGFIKGTGDSDNQPIGLGTATLVTSHTPADGISKTNIDRFLKKTIAQTAIGTGTLTAGAGSDALMDIIHSLRYGYTRSGCKWYCSLSTLALLAKLRDHDNHYVLQPDFRTGTAGTLLGYPIVVAERWTDWAASANFLLFGNMKQAYTITDRGDWKYLYNPFIRMDSPQHWMRKRLGGRPIDGRSMVFGTAAS